MLIELFYALFSLVSLQLNTSLNMFCKLVTYVYLFQHPWNLSEYLQSLVSGCDFSHHTSWNLPWTSWPWNHWYDINFFPFYEWGIRQRNGVYKTAWKFSYNLPWIDEPQTVSFFFLGPVNALVFIIEWIFNL